MIIEVNKVIEGEYYEKDFYFTYSFIRLISSKLWKEMGL